MAKFTLVCPPYLYRRSGYKVIADGRLPPIGLAYIAAALRRAGHAVEVVDAVGLGIDRLSPFNHQPGDDLVINGLGVEEIVERVPSDSDIIGLSCMFACGWRFYKALAIAIRRRFPEKLVVFGGEHATADWEFILGSRIGVDVCVTGEGEQTAVELADRVGSGQDWSNIPGIAHARGGKPVLNPRRKRMAEFIPVLPAWDLFPIHDYLRSGTGMSCISDACFPVLASRGCPYSCTFCSSPQMWGYSYVAREPEEIVSEMKHWMSIYPIRHFIFVDLSTTIKKQWTLDLARLMKERQVGATWHFGSGTRTEIMTDEVIDALKASGLTKIGFAPESGSKKTLENIQKRVNLDKMFRSMKYATRVGLGSKATIMYGLPGQTLSEAIASTYMAAKLAWFGVDELSVLFFFPYPGSQLHNELIGRKLIPDKALDPEEYENFLDRLAHHTGNASSWSDHIPSWMLPIFYWSANLLFLALMYIRRPGKLFRSAARIWRGKPVSAFEERVIYLFSGILKGVAVGEKR